MKTKANVQEMCSTALLCAIGILVPIFSPIKIPIGPMSFTLASHVAIFIAIFINPRVACLVSIGTTLGFALSGMPLVVVLRATSHMIFSVMGALYLQHNQKIMQSKRDMAIYAFVLSVIHAVGEILVVTGFFLAGQPMQGGFVYMVFGLVGMGTVVHSMVDFYIAVLIWVPVSKYVKMSCKINYGAKA